MEARVEIFKSTGFSVDNVPDSAATLRALWEPSVYPDIFVLQDRGNPTIQIETTWNSIKNADYCCINQKTYYWVINIEMVNENMAELTLRPDHLTTIGLENMSIISGWTTRRHVTLDRPFSNNMDEPFQPQQPLELDMGEIIEPNEDLGGFSNMICSTVDLEKFEFDADYYKSPIENVGVAVPKVPPSSVETELTLNANTTNTRTFKMPQTALYNIDNVTVQDKVQSLRSLGIESAITSTYQVPTGYVQKQENANGLIEAIQSKFYLMQIQSLPFEYQEVKNAKALSGQYNRYRIYSLVSGDANEYRSDDIYKDGAGRNVPWVYLFADPQPQGCPYCRPEFYRNNSDDVFIEVVQGAAWQNYQMAFQGMSGQAFADLQRGRKRFEQTLSAVDTGIATWGKVALGSLLGPAGVVAAAGSAVTGIARQAAEYTQSRQDYQNNINIQIPDIRFPISNTLQNYLSNGFWMARVRLSESDTVRFDAFLTQFGYAVSESLKKEHFFGRVHFNYLKAHSINIEAEGFDLMTRGGAINQLENGVRIWHTKPEPGKMYDNPIA